MTHMNTKRRYFYESPKITVVEIRIKSRILILSDPSGNRPGPQARVTRPQARVAEAK